MTWEGAVVTAPSLGVYPPQSQQGRLFLHFPVPMAGGLPRWLCKKEPACQCRRCRRHGFNARVRKIPWRRAWLPTRLLAWRTHGKGSLTGYKESDTTVCSHWWLVLGLSGRYAEKAGGRQHTVLLLRLGDDSPGETQHSQHSWGSTHNRPENSPLPSCSPLSPRPFLPDHRVSGSQLPMGSWEKVCGCWVSNMMGLKISFYFMHTLCWPFG